MPKNMLITKAEMTKLLTNGAKSAASEGGIDHKPVIKLFNPTGAGKWLISEINPANPDIAFGLVDLGTGTPEMGYISISEIRAIRGGMGLPIERDQWFSADKKLTEYAAAARASGRLVA
jgi:hypothetical protein